MRVADAEATRDSALNDDLQGIVEALEKENFVEPDAKQGMEALRKLHAALRAEPGPAQRSIATRAGSPAGTPPPSA